MLITLRDLRVKGSLLIFLACHRAGYYLKLWVFILVGAEGKVEESMELMKEVEDLKVKKKMAEVCL